MKVLPLGSVVTLKDTKIPAKFMIVVRNGLVTLEGKTGYLDYIGCLFPVGMQETTYYFNHDEIDEVLFVGYIDEFEKEYQASYEESMKKIRAKYPKHFNRK